MHPQDFYKLFDSTIDKLRALLAVKSGEYAADHDKLANFRRAAARLGLTPKQVLMVYLDKHYAAIANYIEDESLHRARTCSEPIDGRIHDAMNYLVLLLAIISEERAVSRAINDEPPSGRLVFDDEA